MIKEKTEEENRMTEESTRTTKSLPSPLLCLFLLLRTTVLVTAADGHQAQKDSHQRVHSRQKRLLWITSDGRLALPPGTTMVIAPSLSLPFVRYPPDGFFSNLTISLPFTIDFNKLGLTDNENPYGTFPPSLARSLGVETGNLLLNYVADYLTYHSRGRRRSPRETTSESPPKLEDRHKDAFHGGERALLYATIERFLDDLGMDGKACLLRAICEVHSYPLAGFGLMGEIIKLFFSASKSPYAQILEEYVRAETAGKNGAGDGSVAECWQYSKDCPKSLFVDNRRLYDRPVDDENDVEPEADEERTKNGGGDRAKNGGGAGYRVTYEPSAWNNVM